MVLATRPLAVAPQGMGVIQTIMDEDGIGLRTTVSYDHDYLGAKVTVDVLYGVAELRDNHGVVVSHCGPVDIDWWWELAAVPTTLMTLRGI